MIFSKPVDSIEAIEPENVNNNLDDNDKLETQNKELASFQPSLWPWDSVRNKLR